MKKYPIGIVAVIVIAGFGYVIQSQRSEIRELREQLAAYQGAEVTVSAESPDTPASAIADTIEKPGPDTPPIIEEVPESLDKEADSSGRRVMRNISEMWENPTMNKVMVASQKATLGVLYEDLIDYLVLDEKEKKYFMDLLMARQMTRVESAMKLMGGDVTEDERKALRQLMKDSNEEMREEMEYFLNDEEDLTEWEFYEKTMAERMTVSGFEQALAQTETPLPDGVDRQLVKIMHEEKENFDFSTDLHDESKMDTSAERFSEENLQKFKGDIEDLDALIAERVIELMSTPQFEQFLKNQEQMRQMKLSQLQMAAQMFASEKK